MERKRGDLAKSLSYRVGGRFTTSGKSEERRMPTAFHFPLSALESVATPHFQQQFGASAFRDCPPLPCRNFEVNLLLITGNKPQFLPRTT